MDIKKIFKKLSNQCPSGYKINEIILFAYPYRRIKINATVNKSPENSIQQVYSSFLRTILCGYSTEDEITSFLGLQRGDFILRELYFLRERGYVDFASGCWIVTEQGKEFVKDNSILKILKNEEFEFLLDTVTNEVYEKDFHLYSDKNNSNKLESQIDFPHKSPELLLGHNDHIQDVYKLQNKGKAYLVDYDQTNIIFDKVEYHDYYLIEYIPIHEQEHEPFIEVRNIDEEFSIEKRLSVSLSNQYPNIVYQFSSSERKNIATLMEDGEAVEEFLDEKITSNQTLSIWETQSKFIESIRTAKKRILIESPWIKRASLNYIEAIEKALRKGVEFVVLYGIEGNDEHHWKAIKEMERLNENYKSFNLVHLPTHLDDTGNSQMIGTHRKLLIKDSDYYIHGSFNFLSFNKTEGQKVANEESMLIPFDVDKKWKSVIDEYQITLEGELV
jgi:hypothetical protein